jgi:hypothetical protein
VGRSGKRVNFLKTVVLADISQSISGVVLPEVRATVDIS